MCSWLDTYWTRVREWFVPCVRVPAPSVPLCQKPPAEHLADVWQLVCTDSRLIASTRGLPVADTKKKISSHFLFAVLIRCIHPKQWGTYWGRRQLTSWRWTWRRRRRPSSCSDLGEGRRPGPETVSRFRQMGNPNGPSRRKSTFSAGSFCLPSHPKASHMLSNISFIPKSSYVKPARGF